MAMAATAPKAPTDQPSVPFKILSAQAAGVSTSVSTEESKSANTKPQNSDDMPEVLERIAFCESRGRQFDENGDVVRGEHNPDDIGKYQINLEHWGAEAKKLNYDLFTEEGNRAMALELYRRLGTKPWIWSKPCWDKDKPQQS